ncbi:MAG: biotin/lipoyl-containing protein, partial [Candidatus Neomarinimicrobiota bacterium]|nr:biotin/lipoyl-containing protein [Candidatus Neomarinimicrobiota bacterium]
MIVDIIMPKMGESIMEGTILEWRKKVGDFIEKDELFLEIGTDKVDSEIPSAVSGILVEIIA